MSQRRTRVITVVALATSCGGPPIAMPHESPRGAGPIWVSHNVPALFSKADAESTTYELRIDADRATMIRRTERLADHRWITSAVETWHGVAQPNAVGWLFDFPWQEAFTFYHHDQRVDFPATRLRFSCSPARKRVHAADAYPVDLCTTRSRWTAGEIEVSGWWCETVDNSTPVLHSGQFFTAPPGVEHVSMGCCSPGSDSCGGSDGGLRLARPAS